MPRIGMRIIKSSVAVLCCFLIYMVRQEGIPFYSAIAAVLCMQTYVENGVSVGKNRIVGTLVGGITGMFVLILQRQLNIEYDTLIYYVLISACIIPLIYITLLIDKSKASYITCVVFMSVTVTHAVDSSPYWFAINRIIDTLIGIFVSWGINSIRINRKGQRDILFSINLDNIELSNYSKIKLNYMLKDKASIIFTTSETGCLIKNKINDIAGNIPIIAMNGIALYDINKDAYSNCKYLKNSIAKKIELIFKENNVNYFSYTIIDECVYAYYNNLKNQGEIDFYNKRRRYKNENYICSNIPKDCKVMLFKVIDRVDKIELLYNKIRMIEGINIKYYKKKEELKYFVLEVYSKEASIDKSLDEIEITMNTKRRINIKDCDDDELIIKNIKKIFYSVNKEFNS